MTSSVSNASLLWEIVAACAAGWATEARPGEFLNVPSGMEVLLLKDVLFVGVEVWSGATVGLFMFLIPSNHVGEFHRHVFILFAI